MLEGIMGGRTYFPDLSSVVSSCIIVVEKMRDSSEAVIFKLIITVKFEMDVIRIQNDQ
jgi:hypothetical protein